MKKIKFITLSLLLAISVLYNESQAMDHSTKIFGNNIQITDNDILNYLNSNKNATIRDVAKKLHIPIIRVSRLYESSNIYVEALNNAIGHEAYCNDSIQEFIKNVNNELNNYLHCSAHLDLERIKNVAYKTNKLSYVANLLSKEEPLNPEELRVLQIIKNSEEDISNIARNTGKSKMELLWIYLRSDPIIRAVYDTIDNYLYNKEEKEESNEMNWESFRHTIRFIAERDHGTKLNFNKLDDAQLHDIMFKLGELDTIDFKEKKDYKFDESDIILE